MVLLKKSMISLKTAPRFFFGLPGVECRRVISSLQKALVRIQMRFCPWDSSMQKNNSSFQNLTNITYPVHSNSSVINIDRTSNHILWTNDLQICTWSERDQPKAVLVHRKNDPKGWMTRQIFFGWSESACLQTYPSQISSYWAGDVVKKYS